jgi:methionyl-tRNA synthetase
MPPKKNDTPTKKLEDSSMTYFESEDMLFRLSQVESLVKWFVSKGDLDISMNNLRGYMENSMKGSVKTWDLANL